MNANLASDPVYRRRLHDEAVKALGSRYKLAKALGLSTQRVYAFRGRLPERHVPAVEAILGENQ